MDGCTRLIAALDAAVGEGTVPGIAARVKECLTAFAADGARSLPEHLCHARPGHYARRLLHRAAHADYTVVVMTWGPGQRTELHDHAGMWCVECVVRGRMDVTQYDLVERAGDRFRFEPRTTVQASIGDAGCLIPPYEYHVLANAVPAAPSITVHVYGGEMERCNRYVARGDGWWERSPQELTYDP
jgi:predicted metal-dependent enzyme (double-stranded beta helix superfamily)